MIKLANLYELDQGEDLIAQLYLWLAQRTPEQSISHKTMPCWTMHREFVLKNPYKYWYLIIEDDPSPARMVGSIYLTHRQEVGIHIDNAERGKGYGTQALTLLREHHTGPLLANINPANERSTAFFVKHGAKLIQHTYEL